MNKKVQKGLVAAVAATMGASVVAPTVFAASQTQNVSLATEYEAAYNATAKATASKDQKELTAARVLVDALYARVHGTADEYLATTLSAILDPVQHVKLVALDEAIKKAEVSVKQADINAARELIMEMPDVWKRTFSSAIDTIQAKLMVNVDTALSKVKASRLQVDFDAASLLVNEVLTVTNNAGVKTWADAIKAELDKVDLKLEVTSVTATNANTLTVVGGGLKKLKVEDITMSGNKVTSVTSADGKTATLVLEAKLAPNSTTTVTIKEEAGEKAHEVTFGYVVNSIQVNATTFDDERANQAISFRVNGESADADTDYLTLAGHTITYVATDKDGKAASIFAGATSSDPATNVSTTGDLLSDLRTLVGEYNIEVQITRAGVATVSGKGVVKVANIDGVASTIDSVRFVNGGAAYGSVYNTSVDVTDFIMKSSTLVSGEKVGIHRVKATIQGVSKTVLETDIKVTSSNPAVISVGTGNILTAEAAGTATITVKVGDVTKTYTYTVKNEKRELKSVKTSVSKLDMVINKKQSIDIETFDQYGDPFAVVTGDLKTNPATVVEEVPQVGGVNIVDVAGADFEVETDKSDFANGINVGTQTVELTAKAAGLKTVYFKDASGNVVGSFIVNVSAVDNVATQKLQITSASESTDNALDFRNSLDNTVEYGIANYNKDGIFSEYQDLAGYEIEVVDPNVATVQTTGAPAGAKITGVSGDKCFVVTAKEFTATTKTTDVIVKKPLTSEVVGRFTVTVSNVPFKISSVNFKSVSTIDYIGAQLKVSNILDTVKSADDDIVNGITLNKTTQSKVRVAESVTRSAPYAAYTDTVNKIAVNDLYLDVDNNGYVSNGDVRLGSISATVASTADLKNVAIDKTATADYVNTGFLSAKTILESKGVVIVKIMTTPGDETTSIAATSITIDVK